MDVLSTDTIAAIATAPGEGSIGIVRVSGPAALGIADTLFECIAPPPSQRSGGHFVHGHVRSGTDPLAELDEAILLIYRAPASYTCEDVVEFQCHGGITPTRRVLRATLEGGARMAEPGEFTRRAFLNGRIDLLQAEAVMDIIKARTDRAAACALEQLEGRLSTPFNASYEALLEVAADLEATLDFSEEELPASVLDTVRDRLNTATRALARMLEGWEEGRLLRQGARVVIAGAPNVGKSTLLNTLVGHDRAIVTSTAGTTRDSIEETVVINGFPVCLVDTAGIRESQCDIENEGINRTHGWLAKADLTLWMLDASIPLEQQALPASERPALLVMNKCDLVPQPPSPPLPFVPLSLTQGSGVEVLKQTLAETLGLLADPQPHAVINERHRHLIHSALNRLNDCVRCLQLGRDDAVVLACSDLRDAIEAIGTITGRSYCDGILDTIFSRFCLGK